MYNRKFIQSLSFALNGVFFAYRTESHMRVHIVCALLAVLASAALKVTAVEFLIISFAISLVLVAEMINTVFEVLIDFLKGQRRSVSIRVLKDIAAGGVLIAAINSLVVAAFILLPKFVLLAGKIASKVL